jgi:PD-(D/E)XK endonuclease
VECGDSAHPRHRFDTYATQTSRFTPSGYVSKSYTASEIDAICPYAPELHRSYLIPVEEISGRRAIHLRIDPTRNNQERGIKWARDYELPAMSRKLQERQPSWCAANR